MRKIAILGALLFWLTPGLSQTLDKLQAQSHDDAWQASWVDRARVLYLSRFSGVNGKVLIVGDSISHANPAHRWPRTGSGRTAEDLIAIQTHHLDEWDTGSDSNAGHSSGGYLAGADTSSQRGMSASSGITTFEMLSGSDNGGADMPAVTSSMIAARTVIADGTSYTGNIHIDTLAAAFADAEFAFLMLGTNDISRGRSISAIITDLQLLVSKLEAESIVVILCTVAPRTDTAARATATEELNAAIRQLAQQLEVPLLDIETEHLLRDPLSSSLLSADGIHPSASNGDVTPASNPYDPGGDLATHTTGLNATQSGYLLHAWLRVQKLKEIQEEVVEGGLPENLLTVQALPLPVYGLLLFLLLLAVGKHYIGRIDQIK